MDGKAGDNMSRRKVNKCSDDEIPEKTKSKKNKKQHTRSKFGVDLTESGKLKRTYKGVLYDSVMEMQFYIEYIEPRLESGEIIHCERQVPYVLQQGFTNYVGKRILPIKYNSDFDITLKDGHKIVIDVKGQANDTALLKRKLFWFKYPDVDYRWMTRSLKFSEDKWLEFDELKKLRREAKKAKEKKEKDKNEK